jgi:hypothetical protein
MAFLFLLELRPQCGLLLFVFAVLAAAYGGGFAAPSMAAIAARPLLFILILFDIRPFWFIFMLCFSFVSLFKKIDYYEGHKFAISGASCRY